MILNVLHFVIIQKIHYNLSMASKGKKKKRILVKLHSTGVKSDGQPTGYIYYTFKNPRKTEGKLELMKYDPIIRKHVKFVEKK